MQPKEIPISPLSNYYIPQLLHYISGSNDTFLHRLMNGGNKTEITEVIKLSSQQNDNSTEQDYTMTIFLQLVIFCYVLLGLSHLMNEYLMPCLEKLSSKFDLSETATGILVAIGISIPEMTTNILSVFGGEPEMVGYGFGSIVGSGVFDFTVCFGITSLFSSYYHSTTIKFNMKALLRDIYIYLFTLAYLVVIIQDYSIGLIESLTLTILWPFYVFYSLKNQTLEQDSLDDSLASINTKIPFTKAYESFQRNKNNNSFQPLSSEELESSDEELDILMKKRNNNNHHTQSSTFSSIINKFQKKITYPFRLVFRKTIHYQKSPLISFCLIMAYIFIIIKITMSTVDVLVSILPISHTFVGLTIASWGGNISDIMNASIAAKNKKTEFATSSIIGSQIINLQIALGLPWLLNNLIYHQPIYFGDSSIFLSILLIFIIVLVSFCLIVCNKLELTYKLGIELIVVYLIYFVFEFYNSNN